MLVYKVVQRTAEGIPCSARLCPCSGSLFNDLRSKLMLLYPKGVVVYPKVGKIFAFAKLVDAEAFTWDQEEIWEAETTKARPSTVICGPIDKIDLFWEGGNDCITVTPPPGTLFCDDLKLVRRID